MRISNFLLLLLMTFSMSAFASSDMSTSKPDTTQAKDALAACNDLKEGAMCNFNQSSKKVSGTCQKNQDNKLSCAATMNKNDTSRY